MSDVPRMHDDQLDVDERLVRALLTQVPELAGRPLTPVVAGGTVNAVYRLGDDLVVRVPLQPGGDAGVARECRWLPVLAPLLPVAVPGVRWWGRPQGGYPCEWDVLTWLDGDVPRSGQTLGPGGVEDLAGFLRALWALPTDGAPPAYRESLPAVDDTVRSALRDLRGQVPERKLLAVWESACTAAPWPGPPVLVHGDVLPANLVLRDGRLAGVLDWGAVGAGDPAADLLVAWHLLDAPGRRRFRALLDVDDDSWERGRGWALCQAAVALPYYAGTNPVMVAGARHAMTTLLHPG